MRRRKTMYPKTLLNPLPFFLYIKKESMTTNEIIKYERLYYLII
uniref:Uncharacterized protein n=1 Tax=Lepeophtheirus salmonis TaxID=72036 RepID=A0A0K2UE78_LEPSM